VNSISVKRIGTWLGELTANELTAVDTALAISLGIDFGNVQSVQIREPEPEEIEKLAKEMQAQPLQIMQAENDVEKIKLETERDLYRKLYSELLENVTKGARA
jgi:mRNA interferase MazF